MDTIINHDLVALATFLFLDPETFLYLLMFIQKMFNTQLQQIGNAKSCVDANDKKQ